MAVRSLVSGWTVIKEVAVATSPSRVFKALTTPSILDTWFTHGAKIDLRPGGKYSNFDHDRGTFLEISPDERLRFTWDNPEYSPGSIVEILLRKTNRKTVITLIHSGFKRRTDFEDYASRKSGWNWALSNLTAYLEGRKIESYEKFLDKYNK